MRRKIAAVLAAGLVGGLLAPAASSTAAPLPCKGRALRVLKAGVGQKHALEQVSLKTLHIEAKVTKPVVRIGENAVFEVNVTRPAKEDPLGQGIPMDRPYVEGAANVNIGVGLLIGDVFLPGFSKTDENGDATIKVKMEKYVRPSKVSAAFYTWNIIQETPCATLQENGFRAYRDLFTVKK